MKKGSRSGYDAETGKQSVGSESSLGEPYDYASLYRIRRSQEKHQFCVKTAAGEIVEEGSLLAQRGPCGNGLGATAKLRGALERLCSAAGFTTR